MLLYIGNVFFNGLSADFFRGYFLFSTPTFLESAVGFDWLTYNNSASVSHIRVKESCNIFSFHVDLNLGYKFSLNKNLSIMPYIGYNIRYGLSATNKISTGGSDKTYNQYSKGDMGNNTMKRSLFSIQIGTTATYSHLMFSINYMGCPTDEIYNDINSTLNGATISLGYIF